MPIIMIDVFSSSAPQPANMQEVTLRMFELFLQNKVRPVGVFGGWPACCPQLAERRVQPV